MGFEKHEEYWKDIMENRRMEEYWELDRLETILKGNLYDHNEYAKEINQLHDIMTPLEFWDSKRPYGNKNIEASIAYSLGWDYKRLLTTSVLPDFVEEEARKLHHQLRKELE